MLAVFFVHDSPETHPRISSDELSYLEPYCLKKQPGKKVLTWQMMCSNTLAVGGLIGFVNQQYNSIPWKCILSSVPVHTINVCQFCLNWGFYTLISGLPIFMKEALKFDITQVRS